MSRENVSGPGVAMPAKGVDVTPASSDDTAWPGTLQNAAQEIHVQESIDLLRLKLPWKERIRHFTWAWFTLTMSTAGIANVIYSVPFRFTGLYEIGLLFMILNIIFFLFNCVMISLRFWMWPGSLRQSFIHPTESLFFPSFTISVVSICINITEYAVIPGKTGLWLLHGMTICYWLYMAFAVATSLGIYLTIWSTTALTISSMTPVWIFPAYSLLLVGPFAGVLARAKVDAGHKDGLDVIIGGIVIQGMGFMVTLMIYAAYIYRLMTQKLPAESTRPGMFVSVGPSGFTISGIISMGRYLPYFVPATFMGGDGVLAGQISKLLSYWAGLWLWGLAIWFFLVSLFAHWTCVSGNRLHFSMTFYGFIFPNTGFITGTFNVARALDNSFGIQVLGCIKAVTIVCVWAFIVGLNVRAIVLKQILWPQSHEGAPSFIKREASTRLHRRISTSVGGVDGNTVNQDEQRRKWMDEEITATTTGIDGDGPRPSFHSDCGKAVLRHELTRVATR